MNNSIYLVLSDSKTNEIRYEHVSLPENCILHAVATFNGQKFENFTRK